LVCCSGLVANRLSGWDLSGHALQAAHWGARVLRDLEEDAEVLLADLLAALRDRQKKWFVWHFPFFPLRRSTGRLRALARLSADQRPRRGRFFG
jgi:hypothetical protein